MSDANAATASRAPEPTVHMVRITQERSLAIRLRIDSGVGLDRFVPRAVGWVLRPAATGTHVEVIGTFQLRNRVVGLLLGRLARSAARRAARRALDDLSRYLDQ